MITLQQIIDKSSLHHTRILNVYLFGSQIYGTASDKSDYDVLIIANTPYPEKELVVDNLNIHILTKDRMLEQLKQHHIGKIEAILSPYVLKNSIDISLDIKISSLRHSISHTCSNSWIKCKKKLEQGDYYIGIKSLFHSLRIAMFGIQIAKYGTINDWSCANYIWDKLQSKQWTWEELNEEFRPERNKLLTEFRQITEK